MKYFSENYLFYRKSGNGKYSREWGNRVIWVICTYWVRKLLWDSPLICSLYINLISNNRKGQFLIIRAYWLIRNIHLTQKPNNKLLKKQIFIHCHVVWSYWTARIGRFCILWKTDCHSCWFCWNIIGEQGLLNGSTL